MNPTLVVQFAFWMWITTERKLAKKVILHREISHVPETLSLEDIERSANQLLQQFRSDNCGIVHSDIYCDWSVKSKTQ